MKMLQQVVREDAPSDFNTTDYEPISTPFNVLLNDYQANSSNGSISAFSSTSNKQGFSWQWNWNSIILSVLASLFLIVILSVGIWYWRRRSRRQHSSPLAVNDFIETTKIQEKRLSSSPIKAPPVPPRPTTYTTILGKVEYRSNL